MEKCKKIQQMFIEAYYQELDDKQLEVLEQHLESCSACANEFSNVTTALRNLKEYRQPDPGKEYWESYWVKLSKRIEIEKAQKPSFSQWLKGFIPELKWPVPVKYRPVYSAIALLFIGIIIGKTFFTDTGAPIRQPATGISLSEEQAAAVKAHAERYIGRAKLVLLGIVNYDAVSEGPLQTSFTRQIQVSRSLMDESAALRANLRSQNDFRLLELVSELETILLQTANLDDDFELVDIEMIQQGAERKALLFKINIGGSLLSYDKRNVQKWPDQHQTKIRETGGNLL